MLTLSSIEPEMNGLGQYRAVTHELFHAKTAQFRQLNAHKRVPFHPGMVLCISNFLPDKPKNVNENH